MDYTFESLEVADNTSVIFRGIVGSRAYGTANANSDTDIRGVFVVPSAEYVRLAPPPKQVSDARNDKTYYSLLRFCELMAEANPTTMEMLFLPEDCVLASSPAFRILAENRCLFVTQRAIDSHIGYAVSQMKKARGTNKRVWNPWPEEPPKPEDYCLFVGDVRKPPTPLAESGIDLATCKAASITGGASKELFALYDFGSPTGGVFRGGAPVCESVPKEEAWRRIGILIFSRNAFESAKRQHHQYWDWRRNRNEARWTQQERGEMDYDAKNMMHLMRLLYSGEGIVRNGEPIVRFSGEKLERLLSIRRGGWTFDEIMAEASAVQANIEAGRNRLPAECDRQKVDELIEAVMEAACVA